MGLVFTLIAAAIVLVLGVSAGGAGALGWQVITETTRQQRTLRGFGMTLDAEGAHAGSVDGVRVRFRQGWAHAGVPYPCTWWVEVPLAGSLRVSGPAYALSCEGTPQERSLLTCEVRGALADLPAAHIQDGWLVCAAEEVRPHELYALLHVARMIIELPGDPAERMRLLVEDPLSDVRWRALHLASQHDEALGRELAARVRQDSDAIVRSQAKVLLGEELAEIASNPTWPREIRISAAQPLLRSGSSEQRLEAGWALLSEEGQDLSKLGLELLRAAGRDSEPALIALLSSVTGEQLGHVALVLGEVGTVAAVPALRARQAELELLHPGLSASLGHAVSRIQQESGGVRGGLALVGAPTEQGALSLAAEPGGLSLREDS